MYITKPEKLNGKGIVLIHEFWGLNQQTKNTADKIAKEGFTVLAVDLYEGKVAKSPEEGRRLKDSLNEKRALEIIQQGIVELKFSVEKIAIWGFCMGGAFSFQSAVSGIKAGSYIIYYGRVTDDKKVLEKIKGPVLGIFGGLDKSITRESVESFHRALHDLDKVHEVYIYPEAGHAFANEERESHHKESAKDAWQKTSLFLEKYL